MDFAHYLERLLSLENELTSLKGQPRHDAMTSFLHLTEEVGEVGEVLRQEIMNPKKFSKEHLGEELADVMVFTLLIAKEYGINMSQELEKNLEKTRNKIKKVREKNANKALSQF